MNSITLNLSFWIIKLSPFFVCSYVASIWFTVLNSLFVDVKLIASSTTLLYFDMGPSPESSGTCLFNLLLLKLNLSDLLSLQQFVLLHKQSISVHLNTSLKSPGSRLSCFLWILQHVRGKKLVFASALKESL